MGELLHFPVERARAAHRHATESSSFLLDVCDPFSYLVAEHVERVLGDVAWVIVDGGAVHASGERARGRALAALRARAEARAAELHLPLVWPERFPGASPGARRAATLACELGAGPKFCLALHRLAFCGGFELDDPEVIAEAAAAAAVPLGACLQAVGESWRDEEPAQAAATLRRAGIDALPAFWIEGRWLNGEQGLAAADAGRGARARIARRPLAPVG